MSYTRKFHDLFSRGVRRSRLKRHLSFVSFPLAQQTPISVVGSRFQRSCLLPENLQIQPARDHSTSAATNAIATPTKSSHFSGVDDAVQALKSLLESKSRDTAQKADEILQQLEDRNVSTNFECLFLAIECWSRTKRKGAEERIEELYQQLWQIFKEEVGGASDVNPKQQEERKIHVSNGMMRVLKAYDHVSNAHRAEDLLMQFADNYRSDGLVPPTLEMCKSVLSTWPKSESSRRAIRAEKLLSLMSKDPVLPDPDITCYTSVLNCWASSGKDGAPQRAELLLRSMELAEDESMRSNIRSYSCVLNAWARSKAPDAPEHAERLLREMEEVKGWVADRVVYTMMISVWGRSNRPESITKAEAYFQRLQSLQQTNSAESDKDTLTLPKATVVEYTALIQAWADYVRNNVHESRRAVDRVEYLLEELMEKYFSSQMDVDAESMRPNRLTFASVFRTIGYARRIPDREVRANRALGAMHKLNLEPTTYILNLIDKCTRVSNEESKKRK